MCELGGQFYRAAAMTFQAVIFDMDGTLLDTEAIALAAGHQTARTHRQPITQAQFESLIGKENETAMQELRGFGSADLDVVAFKRDWGQNFRRLAEQGIPVKPGVLELLALLDRAGMPRAVATNSHEKGARLSLTSAGLLGRFQAIVGYDMVARAKPAPDVFAHAARLLGADPARCLAFEDSVLGCRAASEAGMTVVQVPDILPHHSPLARIVAPTLSEGAASIGLAAQLREMARNNHPQQGD